MNNTIGQQPEQLISSYVGKLLRDNFGKGPEAVFVSLGYNFITIYLKNFCSQIDMALQEQNQDQMIFDIREKLMLTLAPKIKLYIEMITKNTIVEFYYDWSLHNKTGILVGIAQKPFNFTNSTNSSNEIFEGKDALENEILRLIGCDQKFHENISSYEINSRTIIVIRKNTTVMIEKELIRKGYSELLKIVRRDLEKNQLHNDVNYEVILKRKVTDIFVDWNFHLDKSIFVIIMNPNKKSNML